MVEFEFDVGYRTLKEALPSDIQLCIQGAQDQLWSFLPKAKWFLKYGRSQITHDRDLLQLFSDRNPTFSCLTNYDVAKRCIKKAMDDQLYQEAMDMIFVVDRYAYWMGKSETKELLDFTQHIITRCKEVAVAPQVILRKVRFYKDHGDYQGADKLTNSVLSSAAYSMDKKDGELMLDHWQFRTRDDFFLTVSAFLLLKGEIQLFLAQAVDAAVCVTAGGQLMYSSDQTTISGQTTHVGQSLQFLAGVLLDMSATEREDLQEMLMFEDYPDMPLMKYFTEHASQILDSLQPGDTHFPKQMTRVTCIELMGAVESEQKNSDSAIFRTILLHLNSSIPENLDWAILEYCDVARDFAYAVFNAHLIFDHFGHVCENVLRLSMQLYIRACGMSSEKDLAYFRHEINDVRNMIEEFLDTFSDEAKKQLRGLNHYPVLRNCSPERFLRSFKNPDANDGISISVECSSLIVDPVATTRRSGAVLPSSATNNFKPKIFQTTKEQVLQSSAFPDADATIADGTVYQSLLSEPVKTVDGFNAPQKLLVAEKNGDQNKSNVGDKCTKAIANLKSVSSSEMIFNTELRRNTAYQANVLKYFTVEDEWRYQKTLVFVHEELQLTEPKKGTLRDVIKMQYLHQDHDVPGALYIGKRYKGRKPPETYRKDVIMHQLSLQCVSRFNKQLQFYPGFANRIQMVPVVHMEILDESGHIVEFLNAEPFINGNFTKMTNNYDKVNLKVDSLELLLAFSHFTWCDSKGEFMVTDLQGFVPEDSQTSVILTDPAVNSEHLDCLGITNMGSEGFKAFWTKQHPECNEVCRLLGLERDSSYP